MVICGIRSYNASVAVNSRVHVATAQVSFSIPVKELVITSMLTDDDGKFINVRQSKFALSGSDVSLQLSIDRFSSAESRVHDKH